jgi:hypothetical protein
MFVEWVPLRSCAGGSAASRRAPDGTLFALDELAAVLMGCSRSVLELASAAVIPADWLNLTPQFLQKLSTGATCAPHRLQTIDESLLASLPPTYEYRTNLSISCRALN